jgi:hypothetical protein
VADGDGDAAGVTTTSPSITTTISTATRTSAGATDLLNCPLGLVVLEVLAVLVVLAARVE